MKQKIIPLCLIILLSGNLALSQTPNRTPEKIKEDSIEFLQFKKGHPALFRNKRMPITLTDGNFYVKGYSYLGTRILNNHLVDSVYHNFHVGSTEEGIIPYNNIQITDEKISIDLFSLMAFTEMEDSSLIMQVDEAALRQGKIDNKPISKNGPPFIMLPVNEYPFDTITVDNFKGDSTEIRISINGKLLFNWTTLDHFTKNTFKIAQKQAPIKAKTEGPWIVQYGEGFHLPDQYLKINDQLLIEIKDDKTGWMLDRFNFVRVAATPVVSFILPTDRQNKVLEKPLVTVLEKKTSYLIPALKE